MGKNLPGLVIKIGANTKDAIDGLNRVNRAVGSTVDSSMKAQKQWEAMGRNVKTVGATVAAVGAAFAVKFGVDAVQAASAMNESLSKSDVVFGNSSKAIQAWADNSATAMLMSKQRAIETTATFGNLFQAIGVGQDKAASMSKELTALGADLASFSNTSVDDALKAIQSGITGEVEPLRRYGVALSDMRMRQQAMTMGIYDGKGVLDGYQKALASYAIIMQDTSLAQGDVARTADGYANTMRALQAATENASATIGQGFLTGLQSASKALGGPDGLVHLIDSSADGIANMAAGFGALTENIGRLGTEEMKPLTERKQGSFVDWITGFKSWSGPFTAIASGIGMVGENARITEAQFADLSAEFQRVAYMQDVYAGSTQKSNVQLRDTEKYARLATQAINDLTGAFARKNGGNNAIIASNIQLRDLRRGGPGSYAGADKKLSMDERRKFGLDYASAVGGKYDALVGMEKFGKAKNLLENSRQYLTSQGLGGLAKNVLSTPPELKAAMKAKSLAKSEANANEWRGNAATVYNTFKIEVATKTPAETIEMVNRLKRLAALDRANPQIDWAAAAQRAVNR